MLRFALLPFALLLAFSSAHAEDLLRIKYRDTLVDVDQPYFEELDTSKSSWIRGAWYDSSNKYMIINLKGTNYHYCGLDVVTWNKLKSAESFGSAYLNLIKGNFDCRIYPVPAY